MVSDLPGGQWSSLLVGHQWPGSESLAALSTSADNRAATASSHHGYAETLRSIRYGVLAEQQGITAEAARHAFRTGEDTARVIAENNEAKRDSYRWAHRHVAELRSALRDIADSGNSEIRRTLDSRAPLAEKISAIVSTITNAQTQANTKAAECSANLLGVIDTALGTGPSGLSAREFSSGNGVDLLSAFRSPSPETLHSRVEAALRETAPADPGPQTLPASGQGTGSPGTTTTPVPLADRPDPAVAPSSTEVQTAVGRAGAPDPTGPPATEPGPSPVNASPSATEDVPPNIAPRDIAPREAVGTGDSGAESETARPAVRLAPEAFFSDLDRTGPWSGSTESHPDTGRDTTVGDAASPTDEVGAPTPASGGFPGVVAPAAALGAPSMPAPPWTAGGSAPVAHAGNGLPAYGSELRSPTTATPPAPPAVAAAPTSAPVGGAGASGAGGQPVVVRRVSGRATDPAASAAGGQSVPARCRAGTDTRLGRLLGSLARQQPMLRWGVGDLDDGSTVVVTDVAGGWIPPDIRIPEGARLLYPPGKAGDVAALLAPAATGVVYRPGQQLPGADDEPVPMADHARQSPPVDDIGWRLARATKWRDGLPRLAHTMAKAGAARSGYLDSEIRLLREHLRTVERSVLSRYPDHLNPTEVGNWQLLASTEALILGDTDRAGYHLAWFLAQAEATEAGEPDA